jgi:RNase H-like domain found in reverse transcriptase/Reverse transcriptase (RNA-dependent DNA polymerase)
LIKVHGLVDFAAPTFLVPKKDGRVRWVSDFRELNRLIKRKVYPLPHINEILKKRKGYNFFTKLDISMQYYTFELDDESKELCTISTPFGNYRYNRAPMGVKQTPDFAQQIMEEVMEGLTETEVYLEDVGIFGEGSFEAHLTSLERVLTRLQDANFTINPLKCEGAVQETDFLGFWLTPVGLKPWRKKIQAILDIAPPMDVKQVRSFIGAVTFYREMFQQRSQVLTPLYQLTESKRKGRFEWTPACQTAFDTVKALLAKDLLIRYPDPNQPFHIYTDASDTQMGAVVMQQNKPVAYFSRKLTSAQRNYTVMEKELLSIVAVLNEYRTMLYGVRELHVHTDHKNLTYANLNSQRVLRWRLFLEEFHPIFHYIEGSSNTLADALLRLPCKVGKESTGINTPRTPIESAPLDSRHATTSGTPDEDGFYHSILIDDPKLLECFLSYPEVTPEEPFALDLQSIADAQQRTSEEELRKLLERNPEHYKMDYITVGGPKLLVYQPYEDAQPRIVIPDSTLSAFTT